MHILNKIRDLIRDCAFGIYDISGWNPYVTLELGLAMGMRSDSYIVFNPERSDLSEVPSDIRGMDRIQYRSYSELQQRLASLLSQRMPLPKQHEIVDHITELRREAVRILITNEGSRYPRHRERAKIPAEMAKLVVRPLVEEGVLEMKGATKGAKYYVATISERDRVLAAKTPA